MRGTENFLGIEKIEGARPSGSLLQRGVFKTCRWLSARKKFKRAKDNISLF